MRKEKLMNGGKLSIQQLNKFLNASYGNNPDDFEGYEYDKSISKDTNKVYHNPSTNHTIVSHRGTKGAKDWLNNIAYQIGGEKLYKLTHRYKNAKRVQDRVQQKYGISNLSTIGHSQGGLQAEMLGKNGNEIITYNKETRPLTNNFIPNNQYDIRNKNDIVSKLNPFQRYNGNEISIPSNSINPLSSHSVNSILNLHNDSIIGRNIIKKHLKRI